MSLLHLFLIIAILLIVFGGVTSYGGYGPPGWQGWGYGGGGVGLLLLLVVLILLFR